MITKSESQLIAHVGQLYVKIGASIPTFSKEHVERNFEVGEFQQIPLIFAHEISVMHSISFSNIASNKTQRLLKSFKLWLMDTMENSTLPART